MPYTTVVAGTTITASWANSNVRDQVVTPFATAAARNSAISSPVEGMYAYTSDSNYSWVYNGTVWVNVSPVAAAVATAEATGSTSFVALTTPGPTVTVDTANVVVIHLSCGMQNTALNHSAMGFAVSGATTLAANQHSSVDVIGAVANNYSWIGRAIYQTGLTAGSNVFTAQYAVTAGTGTFQDRFIVVQAIP